MVIDPKTHITLWNLAEYVRGAIRPGNRDKDSAQVNTIIGRIRVLAIPAAPTTDAARNKHSSFAASPSAADARLLPHCLPSHRVRV